MIWEEEHVKQVVRFGAVGFASNMLLYLLYLGLTAVGLDYKIAMSLLYIVGVLQTFLFNKRWTFVHHGHLSVSLVRYISLYVVAYLINLGVLFVLVDQFGWSHQLVQGVMIIIIAACLFLMQKYWVFSEGGLASVQRDHSS